MTQSVETVRTKRVNILSLQELCDIFGIESWYDPEGTGKETIIDRNRDYIEDNADYKWAREMGYEVSGDGLGSIRKVCPECDGDGYIVSGFDDLTHENTELICETCVDGYVEITDEEYEERYNSMVWETAVGERENELIRCWTNAFDHMLEVYLTPHHLTFTQVNIPQPPYEGQRWTLPGYRLTSIGGKTWEDVAGQVAETCSGYGMFYYDSAKELKDAGPYPTYRHAAMSHFHWIKHYGEVYGIRSAQTVFDDDLESELRNW